MSHSLLFENGAAIAQALISHDPISTTVKFSFRQSVLYVQGVHPTNRETYCIAAFDAHMSLDSVMLPPLPNLDIVVLQNASALELKEFRKQKNVWLQVYGEQGKGVSLTFNNSSPIWFVPPKSIVPCAFYDPEQTMHQLWQKARAPGSVLVQMPSAEFQHIIKDLAIVGAHLEVSFNPEFPDRVLFCSQGENMELVLTCESDFDSKLLVEAHSVDAAFSCEFVINHIKMTAKGVSNSEKHVCLTFARDAPLMLGHGTADENNLCILFAQSSKEQRCF